MMKKKMMMIINNERIYKLFIPLATTLCIFIFLPAAAGFAQQQNTGFLNAEETSARTYALGGANLADYHDVTVMSLNPAILIENDNSHSIVFGGQQIWGSGLAQGSLGIPLFNNQRHAIAVGMNYHSQGIEDLNYLHATETDLQPDIRRFQFSTGYSIAINSKLSAGVHGNLIHSWNKFQKVWSGNIDAGILYTPTSSLSYAVALRNLGSDVRYSIDFDGTTILKDRRSQKSLDLGATMQFPDNSDRSFFSLSLANKKIFGEDGLIYKGGIEFKPITSIALRTGYLRTPDENGPRFGIGLITDLVHIDYAIAPLTNTSQSGHHFSLSFNLDDL